MILKNIFLLIFLFLIACGQKSGEFMETESGLKYQDNVVGDGISPQKGQRVSVHFTGWLYDEKSSDKKGMKFDSSIDKDRPFGFVLGVDSVIKGWDEGVLSMRVGGKRTLTIPPGLGYGSSGIGPIPPNATLIFDVELIQIY